MLIGAAVQPIFGTAEHDDPAIERVVALVRLHGERPVLAVVEHDASARRAVATGRRHVEHEQTLRREGAVNTGCEVRQRIETGPGIGRVVQHLADGGHRYGRRDLRVVNRPDGELGFGCFSSRDVDHVLREVDTPDVVAGRRHGARQDPRTTSQVDDGAGVVPCGSKLLDHEGSAAVCARSPNSRWWIIAWSSP